MQTNSPKFLSRAPFLLSLSKVLTRAGVRGAHRFSRYLCSSRVTAGKIAPVSVGDGIQVFVPLYRPEAWDRQDLEKYECRFMDCLVEEARKAFKDETVLVDVGADIGLISAMICRRLDLISKVVAFEPSDEAIPALERTLSSLNREVSLIRSAVADFDGFGRLSAPHYDASHHARFLERSESGFLVQKLDDLDIRSGNLLIKIDVEGGEAAVIRGAKQTIASAESVVVTLEAHPLVFGRTWIDPCSILSELSAIRPFSFVVAESRETKLQIDRPFFNQVTLDGTIYNIVCRSIVIKKAGQ